MHLEIKENYKVAKKRDSFFMYFCVLTGNLLTLSLGASMSWTSPVLTKLSSNNTDINPLGRPITAAEVSMLAGIPTFTSTFGLLITPKFSDIFGLGPVPHLLTAELPPVELRATMAALVLSSGYVVVFVFTSLYPFVSEMYGNEWCVWWFSLNCAVGTILMYFFLPETKGKSLDEIQDMLKNYSELKIR